MRPKGLALIALAFASSLALAQPALAQSGNSNNSNSNKSNGDNGVGFGVEAMAAFPSLGDVDTKLSAKTGYGFGAWVGGNRNGVVGFTGEFIYRVTTEEYTNSNGVVDTAKHKALEIPAVFHINFGQRSNANGLLVYGVAGPVFTINVSDSVTGIFTNTTNSFSSADVGGIFGAGVEIMRISIEGRANLGFKTVTSNGGGVFQDSKQRSFELLGKFRFN